MIAKLKYIGNNSFQDIEISNTKKTTIIGRNDTSGIQSPLVSREHLVIKPDFEKKLVLIKFQGKSPATLNNFVLTKSEAYEAKANDIVNLVFGSEFKYRIEFETEIKRQKRRSEEDIAMTDGEAEKVKRTKSNDDDKWDHVEGNNCLVFTSKGVVGNEKIAAYDMDNTLIKTVSGNVFPKSIDDWQLNMSVIPNKLKKLHENGFKIVVFTNQGGIDSKRTNIPDVKKKIAMIQQRISCPIQFFIATGYTNYRKPRTGMWDLLQKNFNDGIKIDMTSSFYIGDAAGRPENKILKKKKDHSSADRLFALNLKLNFFTPEEHFQNAKKNPSFIRPEYNPKASTEAIKLLEPEDAKLKSDSQELIIFLGFPASGKSFFCNKYLKKEGYVVVNRDTLNSMQKCLTAVEESLKNNKSCVVDNTNPDIASRKKFIDIAKGLKVKVRAFWMNTTYHHSKHNNVFRELTDSTHQKIADVIFNTYKNKFVAPALKEGFEEIVKVNCVPSFEKPEHEKLYRSYLLEK